MEESNVHSSHPNTVIVHHGNRNVFVVLPEGSTWADARFTFAWLVGRAPLETALIPYHRGEVQGASIPYDDGAVIDWGSGNCVHAQTAVLTEIGSWEPLISPLPPIEPQSGEGSDISYPVAMGLDAMRPTSHLKG
uniref:Uncharacterized protein n=1 Tax=Trypanosoma congolense (strain IL3000) TaxID=1068625 RepID=G0UP13_TRYCI|nr:conserved hypothetical protein [Trypanosoma congolense IL3000]